MNKILSNAIFYGTAIIIGGTIGSFIGLNQTVEPNNAQEVTTLSEEGATAELIQSVTEVDEKSVGDNVEEKPSTSAPQAVAVQTPPKPATQVTPKVTPQVSAQESSWVYYMDEEKYLGLCPSQRPVEAKNNISARLNAIEIISSGPNSTSGYRTLNNLIETWWDSYKQGRWGTDKKYMMATLRQMPEFDDTYANSRVGMFIDFDGFFVSWDNSWENGETINISESQRQVLNKTAGNGTLYLRSLEERYKAKCPND